MLCAPDLRSHAVERIAQRSGMIPADQADVQQLVDRYVHQLKMEGAIRSPAVERAFRTVQRHRLLETFYHRPLQAPDFAPVHHDPEHPTPEHLELIYADTALATRLMDGMPASSTSQPSLVAQMLELLDLTPDSGFSRSARAPATTPR
jgi:protein-L-isoaspartate(D-aspartate) O-methyltransferase